MVWSANNFLKRDDEFLLVIDQATQRGQLRAAGEFADVPSVLGKEVERVFLGRADEVLAVRGLGFGQTVETAGTHTGLAAVEERADLEEDAVAILQGADDRTGIAAEA